LIADVIKYVQAKEDIEPQLLDEDTLLKHVLRVVRPAFEFVRSASDADIFDKFGRRFGEGGVRDYADRLAEIVLQKFPDFGSDDFKARLARRSDERIKETNQDVIQLATDISDYVFRVLRQTYGTQENKAGQKAYWDIGVESEKIKTAAYTDMLAEKSKHPIETYVNTLGIKEIVTQKNNWPLFESVFSIPLPEERKGKMQYTSWLNTFNEIRRIPAHPSGSRVYEEEQYAFMKFIKYEFYNRLEKASVAAGVERAQ
jgi:hypothetical protein